jgi:hypothetical protein
MIRVVFMEILVGKPKEGKEVSRVNSSIGRSRPLYRDAGERATIAKSLGCGRQPLLTLSV